MAENTGEIIQVIGPVIDVSFERSGSELPNIHDALSIDRSDGSVLIVECQQHIGEHTVRTISMDSTDGLRRGMKVVSKGGPITMPVGEKVRGRLLNVIGESIDGIGPIEKKDGYPIHNEPPELESFYRNKSDRPVGTLYERWKNRFVWWCGCW